MNSGFTEAEMTGVAVTSAGSYAKHLHLDTDKLPCQHLNTQKIKQLNITAVCKGVLSRILTTSN